MKLSFLFAAFACSRVLVACGDEDGGRTEPVYPVLWYEEHNVSIRADIAQAVAVSSDRVVIVGLDGTPQVDNTLDMGWRIEVLDHDGFFQWEMPMNPAVDQSDGVRGVAADETGFYVASWEYFTSPGDWQWRIEKRTFADGTLVWSESTNPSVGYDRPMGVAIDPTGLYVAGHAEPDLQDVWRLEKRSLSDGTLIWEDEQDPTDMPDRPEAVAVAGGLVYVVGSQHSTNQLDDAAWRIHCHDASDGALLWSQVFDGSEYEDIALGAAADETGVYVVGYVGSESVTNLRAEKRSPADGTVLWERSVDGAAAWGAAVDGTGLFVVGARDVSGVGQWRVEKRDLENGTLLWADHLEIMLGGSGARGVSVGPDGSLYVVGHDTLVNAQSGGGVHSTGWRVEKRVLPP